MNFSIESKNKAQAQWLSKLEEADVQKGPKKYTIELLSSSLVYPMLDPGDDTSPLQQFSGNIFSHIFMFPFEPNFINDVLNGKKIFDLSGHVIIFQHEFRTSDFVETSIEFKPKGEFQRSDGNSRWLILEKLGRNPSRISLLLLDIDPYLGMAGLYFSQKVSPLVFVSHGHSGYFDGSQTSNFFKQSSLQPPEYLLARADSGIMTPIYLFGSDYVNTGQSSKIGGTVFPGELRLLFKRS